MASLAGVISSIRTSAANPNSGTGYELEVIAMVVIGGTALTGGRGTIIGTVLGIFILRVMRNGIVLIGVPGLAYNIFVGAIILGFGRALGETMAVTFVIGNSHRIDASFFGDPSHGDTGRPGAQ